LSKQTRYLGYLTQAERHVRRGREIVARQRKLIADLGAQGSDTQVAEELLAAFERSQELFEDDLAGFENAVARHLDEVEFEGEVTAEQ
jgi:pantothenate kinase-related protein Tda10